MASIRAQAEPRHSMSKYGHVDTFRTVSKDNSEHHVVPLTMWSCKIETFGSRMTVLKLFLFIESL